MSASDRRERILAALASLEPSTLELNDESSKHAGHAGAKSGLGHFQLLIIAPCFSGKGPVARHRMIYASLGTLMQTDIHALRIEARAPEEA